MNSPSGSTLNAEWVDGRPPQILSPVVDVVVPVYNEAGALVAGIERLHAYLSAGFPFSWRITIADNASVDGTLEVARQLEARLVGVRVLHLDRKGRGVALRTAWMESDAVVLAYMDVDLSTGLDALLPLVAPLVSGHSDLAIGSRLSAGSNVARGPKRELISRIYNLILRLVFSTRIHDAQCGFKAVRADVAAQLVPAVADDSWFFDTELLLVAEHNGLRILEVPVDWVDDPDSRVDVRSTALEDLKGVARVAVGFIRGRGQLDLELGTRRPMTHDLGRRFVSFAVVGMASTIISFGTFLALRPPIGSRRSVVAALALTSVGNAWAHRRFTLGFRGRRGLGGQVIGALTVAAAAIVASVGAIALVDEAGGGLAAELAALAVVWTLSGAVRLALLAHTIRTSETGAP